MSWRNLISLFHLRVGDNSNCPHWVRCLLLVYCWIWKRGTPLAFPFRPHRYCLHFRSYFAPRSRILLLSNLGDEQQTVLVDLLDHCCCMYTPLSPLSSSSDTSLNTECGDSISRIDVAGHQSHFYTQFYVNLFSYTALRQSWLGSMWIPGLVIMYSHSFWSKWPYHLTHFCVSYGQYRVPWQIS